MPKFSRDTEVLVGEKTLKIEEILKSIIYLPASNVFDFFKSIGLNIPRELRIYVLRENLREIVAETRKSRLTLADELNYRLSWFSEFTETQLENLLVFFNDQKITKRYLEDLWTDLFGYMVDKKVPPFELEKLVNESINYVKANDLSLPEIGAYNLGIEPIFYDSFGRIDGVSPNKIRNVLYKSSTINEIRALGKKYEVNIPRRLKKNQLADIIISELKDKGDYTEALETQVRSMSVIIMQRFAIDHDIKASTELKKEEVIEYILKNSKETKETYFVPKSREVYEKELSGEDSPGEPEAVVAPVVAVESAKEEPVVEEEPVIEEETITEEEVAVEEEPVVEEEPMLDEEVSEVETKVEETVVEKVQYVAPQVNLDALVEEVKKLREAVQSFELKTVQESVEEELEEDEVDPGHPLLDIKDPHDDAKVEVINSAEYIGTAKDYKKVVKKEDAIEKEIMLEQEKAEIKSNKEDTELPSEVRFLGRVGKAIFKGLSKVVLFLLKWVLILALIGIILLVAYAALDYALQITFFDSITNSINSFQIAGKGIIDHIWNFFATLGWQQAV
jgi:hypothetical protein